MTEGAEAGQQRAFAPSAARSFAPSAARNAEPIGHVVRHLLAPGMRVLEIASGTGQHAAAWSRYVAPGGVWQTSEANPARLDDILEWHTASKPVLLDVVTTAQKDWPKGPWDGVVCVNMLHIAPIEAAHGLLQGAMRALTTVGAQAKKPGGAPGFLLLYGPFAEADGSMVPSNQAFDADLRRRDPRFGIRRQVDVVAWAKAAGFGGWRMVPMPANNRLIILWPLKRS